MVVADLPDLVEEGELRRIVLGDRRLDVLVVWVSLQLLQIFVVRAVDMKIYYASFIIQSRSLS